MEILSNGFRLEIPEGVFPLTTDSMLLADFVKLPAKAKILDLGAGCGTLGLLLCARDPDCRVTGVEITENAHTGALANITANSLQDRMTSICADLRVFSKAGQYDVCISNPPYFPGGPASKETPLARMGSLCSTEELLACAGRNLKFGGDLFLVHRPEALGALCTKGGQQGLELKRLRLIRHREGGPVTLLLLQFRKGGRPGLRWEEESLLDTEGAPTAYYQRIYT